MSNLEIFTIILMMIIALQMILVRHMITSSLATLKACSETNQMAMDLAIRVLDGKLTETSDGPTGTVFGDQGNDAT